LHGLDVVSCPEAVYGVSVPERMKGNTLQTDFLHHPFEVHIQRFIVDITPGLCGEHQIFGG